MRLFLIDIISNFLTLYEIQPLQTMAKTYGELNWFCNSQNFKLQTKKTSLLYNIGPNILISISGK